MPIKPVTVMIMTSGNQESIPLFQHGICRAWQGFRRMARLGDSVRLPGRLSPSWRQLDLEHLDQIVRIKAPTIDRAAIG
jgi:hypothetical protein